GAPARALLPGEHHVGAVDLPGRLLQAARDHLPRAREPARAGERERHADALAAERAPVDERGLPRLRSRDDLLALDDLGAHAGDHRARAGPGAVRGVLPDHLLTTAASTMIETIGIDTTNAAPGGTRTTRTGRRGRSALLALLLAGLGACDFEVVNPGPTRD